MSSRQGDGEQKIDELKFELKSEVRRYEVIERVNYLHNNVWNGSIFTQ